MPDISLTSFVDFIAKAGTPKLTHVRALKKRGIYSPAEDFWRRLREDITEFHSSGQTNKAILEETLTALADPKKRSNYREVVDAYKRFLGNKNIQWFAPSPSRWSSGGTTVRVNPELGLVFGGKRHHVKLYFKTDPLVKAKADMILLLLEQNLANAQPGDNFCILDVRRTKLHSSSAPDLGLMPLLQGEASSFATIWNSIP